jgi:hypothetical protein
VRNSSGNSRYALIVSIKAVNADIDVRTPIISFGKKLPLYWSRLRPDLFASSTPLARLRICGMPARIDKRAACYSIGSSKISGHGAHRKAEGD